MTERATEDEFEWEEADGPRGGRGPSRRTFLKSTGAVASATALLDAADTARGAIPEKPETVDSVRASATVLAQAQSPSLCGSGSITFADQTSDGSTVVVESVTLSAGGFVDIHDDRLSDAPIDALESIIGVSGYLTPGIHRDVTITLFDVPGKTFDRSTLDADQTLTAMAHHDTDGDGTYDFAVLNGAEDRPYLNDDASTVSDSAVVTVAAGPQRNTLRIQGTGPRGDYGFAVTGDLTGEGLTAEDSITGSLADGAVGPGADRYTFTGDLTGLSVDGTVRVFVNDTRVVDFSQFPPTALTIQGTGPRADYSFGVSGDLAGSSLTAEDRITGSSATGAVGPGADRYEFTGAFTRFDLDGEARVLVNGQEIDVAVTPTDTLAIRGSGSRADYAFSVTDEVTGEGLTAEDSITGPVVAGAVRAGADRYEFTGSVTGFVLDGRATVLVNGTSVDPARFPPTTLVIRGTGPRADYSFAVSGDLAGESLTREDRITGSSAEGAVGPGSDRYRFSGDITRFALDGRATVLVNGTRIDPGQF